MRCSVWVCLLMLAVSLGAAAGEDAALAPGGMFIQGITGPDGAFHLSMAFSKEAPEGWKVYAAKVSTFPSDTLLFAAADWGIPDEILLGLQAEGPLAMTQGTLLGSEPVVGMEAPPAQDDRVVVQYVVDRGAGPELFVLADVTLQSAGDFGFSSEPEAGGGGGGGYRWCAYCSGLFCGCLTCSQPAHTLCCPECTMVCGAIYCP